MKKKLIISVTNDISYDQRMLKTAQTLAKNGFDITIVGRWKSQKDYPNSSYFKSHRFKLLFNKGKWFYVEYNIHLLIYLLFTSFDILCAVDLDTIIPNILIGKLKSKKVMYDAHEYFTEVPELVNRPFEKSVWKQIERWSIPKCSKMYTVAPIIASIFEKEYHVACDVIYNFPFLEHREGNNKYYVKSNRIILYQGDLNMGRGLEATILAMKNLDAEMWIAGDGLIMNSLKKLIEENDLTQKVKLLGRKSPEELKEITKQAYIGFNLLENKGLNYYYSLANKFFDYIQQGIPSINMNFPEYQSIVNQYHCAILIDDIEVKTIEMALKSLLENENLYKELQKNCDIARSYLNWDLQEEKLCSIYNND